MTTYEITHARILDGTGRAPFAGSVRVEGNRIVAVRPGSPPPDGGPATVIEGAGRALMPGLVESHAHIGLADTASYDLTVIGGPVAVPGRGTTPNGSP
jgi:imidazolonepropionase-like amidohydrolase